jgi:hypothetical protein
LIKIDNEYIQEFEKFDKMRDGQKVFDDFRDEYEDTDEKDAFELGLEIPDDEEEFQMHTPSRRKDSDELLI